MTDLNEITHDAFYIHIRIRIRKRAYYYTFPIIFNARRVQCSYFFILLARYNQYIYIYIWRRFYVDYSTHINQCIFFFKDYFSEVMQYPGNEIYPDKFYYIIYFTLLSDIQVILDGSSNGISNCTLYSFTLPICIWILSLICCPDAPNMWYIPYRSYQVLP